MTTSKTAFILTTILIPVLSMVGCVTTAPAPTEPVSDTARNLIDPSSGFAGGSAAALENSKLAWRAFQSGQLARAEQIWREILMSDPDFAPARVGLASVAVARNQLERAGELTAGIEPYPASIVLEAELLASQGRVVEAAEALRPLTSRPETASQVISRYEGLRERAIARLLTEADVTSLPAEKITILKRALDLAPQDLDLRLRLVEELIDTGSFADARSILQPALEHSATVNRVQAAFAEIEIGEGKYQSAMRRYERLVSRTDDVVYAERLERAKRLWHESTLPQQFQLAVRSPNITREQLATLLFWKLPSIRFAQNLRQPEIVVDIGDVMAKEELIRVLSIGLLPVDRRTRTARPRRTVTADELLTTVAAALRYVSSDPCTSAGSASTPAETLRACGIEIVHLQRDPLAFVTGEMASAIVDQIVELDRSAE